MVKRDIKGRFVKGSKPIAGFKKGQKMRLGSKQSKEAKRKISLANLGNHKKRGKKLTRKQRENISLGHRGQIKSPKAYSFGKGKDNPNWKGGVTPLNKLLRRTSKWKIWRELVFLRDNFTCQNPHCEFCNNKIGGIMLHPHHIKQLAFYPELVFRVDNGITYCAEFHLKSGLHKKIMQKEC